MVLCRLPKAYKHLMRIMTSQLVTYQNILTTKAKAKHLRKYAGKVLKMAKKAERGQTSPLNLLKGRLYTREAEQKLILDLIPRIKHFRGPLINISRVVHTRRGDGADLVRISIKGNPLTEYENKRKEQAIEKGEQPDLKAFSSRTLMEQKQYYQKKIEQNPQQAEFFRKKIARVEFEQWMNTKQKKQPPKYSLLI